MVQTLVSVCDLSKVDWLQGANNSLPSTDDKRADASTTENQDGWISRHDSSLPTQPQALSGPRFVISDPFLSNSVGKV